MKLLVLSDSHRYLKNAEFVLNHIGKKMDGVFHLGDHVSDARMLQKQYSFLPFYYIKGNNDYENDVPDMKTISLSGKKFLLTHGHKQHVYFNYNALYYLGEEKEADAVLFGHTHMPVNDASASFLVLNPGSISLPRNTDYPTFAIIEITSDGLLKSSIMAVTKEHGIIQANLLPRTGGSWI